MSVRAIWSTTEFVDISVVDDFTDLAGSLQDTDAELAILLSQDEDVLAIEALDVSDLRAFINRLTDRVNTYARQHGEDFPEREKTKVWTLTVVDDDRPDKTPMTTTVHATEEDCWASLRENFDPDGPLDEPPVGIVARLEEEQGLTIDIDVHEI